MGQDDGASRVFLILAWFRLVLRLLSLPLLGLLLLGRDCLGPKLRPLTIVQPSQSFFDSSYMRHGVPWCWALASWECDPEEDGLHNPEALVFRACRHSLPERSQSPGELWSNSLGGPFVGGNIGGVSLLKCGERGRLRQDYPWLQALFALNCISTSTKLFLYCIDKIPSLLSIIK